MKKLLTQVLPVAIGIGVSCFLSINTKAQHSDTLYSVADAYVQTFGGGQGKNTFMKFDISSIPANSVVSSVTLDVYVTLRALSWDDDVKFMNVNSQTWVESDLETTLFGFLRTDTVIQLLNFGSALGWTSSVDIKQIFLKDYNQANSFSTVMLKDPDDPTCCPAAGNPAYNSNDSLMTGNIFNDYIIYTPRETPATQPRLVVTYTVAPTITTQPANVIVCDGGTATFSVTATGDAPLSYQWQKNGVDIGGATSSVYTINPVTLADAGNYRCYVTNSAGADTSNAASLTVNTLPVVSLGADVTQCGGTVLLDAGNAGSTYVWQDASTAQTLTVSSSGTYSVLVTDANGCTGSDTADVTINTPPVVSLGADATICGSTMLDAGNAGSSYLWSDASTNQTLTVSASGTYSVLVTDANGCTGSDTVIITINPAPIVTVVPNTTICSGSSATLCASGAISYLWSTGATTTCIGVSPTATTSYTVTGTDANGCTASATMTVTIGAGPTVLATSTPVSCSTNDGTATASPSGGTPPYIYSWSTSPAQTTQTAIGLMAGSYTVTVTDASGCSSSTTVNVTSAASILATTFAGGNNHRGNMFDVTALTNITITSVDAHPMANTGYEIYYKTGTYVGFESNAGAWTLAGSAASVVAQTSPTPTPIPIALNIPIAAGQTYAMYVTSTNIAVSQNYTNGTLAGNIFSQDANIQFKEGCGLEYPFATAVPFTPRVWNGQIHYCTGPVGTQDHVLSTEKGVKVYPNPSNGMFTIQMDNGQLSIDNYQLSIINVLGEKVFTSTINHQPLTINLNVPAGIYFYRVNDVNGAVGTGKIVIE